MLKVEREIDIENLRTKIVDIILNLYSTCAFVIMLNMNVEMYFMIKQEDLKCLEHLITHLNIPYLSLNLSI